MTGDIAAELFNANNGDVVLTGTNQLISGNNIFYDLTKIDGGLDTLTFAAGDTQTVTGQLKLAGTDTNQLLSCVPPVAPVGGCLIKQLPTGHTVERSNS